ncbi:hypothetical protein D5R81_09620 [Parashewanella spongiae]|uniref:Uncharacterized protein n=1 Tax=Parashewanella spongiae TaxID=342950 RepID=A0A3A6UFY0_9GAMM|nr:hypothetical protein [Parashewanella spongiae]MCL1078149.1 hypothetical protein [Parashewanella spongiae]RJY16338.1 hypothetical protein D5R81_09620 [Parashewanella spongiae]
MDQITSFPHANRSVPLVIPSELQENTFSIIIGKNGIGKSRLLNRMVLSYRKTHYFHEPAVYNQYVLESFQSPKVIAVSTSPFDKFPNIPKRKTKSFRVSNYRYVGIRSNSYASSATNLFSSVSNAIIERYLTKNNYGQLISVFEAIEYLPSINLTLKSNLKQGNTVKLVGLFGSTVSPVTYPLLQQLKLEETPQIIEGLESLNDEELDCLPSAIESLRSLTKQKKEIKINIDFKAEKINFPNDSQLDEITFFYTYQNITQTQLDKTE